MPVLYVKLTYLTEWHFIVDSRKYQPIIDYILTHYEDMDIGSSNFDWPNNSSATHVLRAYPQETSILQMF